MRSAWLLSIPVIVVIVLIFSPEVCARDTGRPGILGQARPQPAPPRPKSFDELVNEYNRLKAAKARNTDLGRIIRYASSYKEQRVIQWLLGIYRSEKDTYLRQTALTTVGNMRNREAAAALRDLYGQMKKGDANSADASMKTYLLRALRSVAEFLPMELLVELLKESTSPHDRSSIAQAIGKIGTKEAITVLLKNLRLDKSDPNMKRYGGRYTIAGAIKSAAANCMNEEIITWIIEEVLTNRKVLEDAKVALLQGFADRNQRYQASERKRKEAEERRKKEDEARKKAQEAAKKDPNAAPPLPPPSPVKGASSENPLKSVPASRFLGLLDSKSPAIRRAVAALFGMSDDASMIPVLIKHLSEKDLTTLVEIILALGRLKAQDALEPLIAMLKKSKWEIKAAVIDALGKIGDPFAVDTLKKYLNDSKWQVRAAAIDALSNIRSKEAVTALIERMRKEKGRLLGDIARALEKLTALELGSDARAWLDWWKSAKDRYVLPREVTRSPETANPGIAQGPRTEVIPTYHGIEILSHKICFIIDISGSMSSQMRTAGGGTRKPGQPGAPGSPGTADPNKKKEAEKKKKEPIFKGRKKRVQPKNNTKIEFAKAEMINCIIALTSKVRFNIISFESSIQAWHKRLVSASRANKQSAIKWTTAMTPRGSTNLGDAILLAFKDREVDTMFVLSDGSPNSGQLPSPDAILNEVRRINTTRRVVIHTINFSGARDFMKRLAEQNGGTFVDY